MSKSGDQNRRGRSIQSIVDRMNAFAMTAAPPFPLAASAQLIKKWAREIEEVLKREEA